MSVSTSITVAQLGAREHYAIPRTLHQHRMLQHFYTDICAVKGLPKYLRLIPSQLQGKSLARLTGRIPEQVPHQQITAFSGFGFEYVRRLRQAKSAVEITKTFLWAGQTFGELILKQGLKGSGVYTFNTAGLEILQKAKKQKLRTIMSQSIAPNELEYSLLSQEQQLHPDWEEPLQENPYRSQYIEREQQEWDCADTIWCGSEFVKEGIARCGGPVERCVVVPYGVNFAFDREKGSLSQSISNYSIDSNLFPSISSPNNRPLRVLTVGSVGLRKGSPYVLEAAKKLKNKAVFQMVGPVGVFQKAAARLQDNLELVGQVPRSQIKDRYAWADVFLLPSICEGSALATYEALACGLPVITTPNTGSIVRDGLDGYVVPIRDVNAIVEKLESLIFQPELLSKLAQQARERSAYGNLQSYSERFIQQIQA